jgi:hypothetical protein
VCAFPGGQKVIQKSSTLSERVVRQCDFKPSS